MHRYAGASAQLSSNPLQHPPGQQHGQRTEKIRQRHGRFDAIVGVEEIGHLRVLRRFFALTGVDAGGLALILAAPAGLLVLLEILKRFWRSRLEA